ncbi:FUSC family protein [Actinotalea sp. JY-7876]|uniref:FUSC family protein n=2 Tax=unclassified Actinotalea TaxID=2638618 RepID=UPI0015F3C101|nr:FUSC family protein [Actinotalea sp. JY-7876]
MTSARVVARARVRQGWRRVRRAALPVLGASVAAGAAWAIAHYGLGHPAPFFAPVSAWVALGFTADRQPRRVAELAAGVAVGVLLGDLLVHVIGTGPVQIAVVLSIAALVGRFIDRGALFTMQAGVQSIVIVALPALQAGSPVGRWLDALVGGVLALMVATLWPQDPRRRVRAVGEEALTEVAELLRHLATGLERRDEDEVEEALARGRASQPVLDQWRDSASAARQSARVSPAFRRHVAELRQLEGAAVCVDRAMRNARVLARRSRAVVRETHDLAGLAALVEDVATAAGDLAGALGSGGDRGRARERLADLARRTDPWLVVPDDWHAQSLVLLLRSLLVDLLEAAGAEPGEARANLPEI